MTDVNMPKLSDTMEEGTIVEWKKKTGDEVKAGDVLAEVESDKATFDLEAETGGVLAILVEQGVPAKIGARSRRSVRPLPRRRRPRPPPPSQKSRKLHRRQSRRRRPQRPPPHLALSPKQKSMKKQSMRTVTSERQTAPVLTVRAMASSRRRHWPSASPPRWASTWLL